MTQIKSFCFRLLSAEIMLCKLTVCKTDKNLESFFETMATVEKPQPETAKLFVSIIEQFPFQNIEALHRVERKLKNDETFHSQVVRYFILLYIALHSLHRKIMRLLSNLL